MNYCIIIGIITTFFAFLARYKSCKYGLELAFFILTLFLAIRYDWGSDYNNYLAAFERINRINSFSLENLFYIVNNEDGEIGWIIINIIFSPFGFFGMVICLTCFENYILFSFIKKYVNKRWYWLSVFIFVFSSAFMITGSSMMRQYLAMTLFVMSIPYIIGGKIYRFAILIFIATTIHTTAFILFPIYFLRYLNLTINKFRIFLFVILYILFFYGVKLFLEDFMNIFMSIDRFERYEHYLGDENEGIKSGMGVLFFIFMAFCSLYYSNFMNKKYKVLIYLSFFSILFYPFYNFVPLTSRLTMYFSYLIIVTYPIIFNQMTNKFFTLMLLFPFMILTIIVFYSFFYSPIWHESIIEYSTIFSAPNWR